MRWLATCAASLLLASPAWAFNNCSGTATTSSAPLTLRTFPQAHLEIGNPGTNTGNICINPFGGTAACAGGNWVLAPGTAVWRDFPSIPAALTVISPSGSQGFTCDYQ